jgi:hypothetical protein
MFAHCCGHATIVAQGQPLFELINLAASTASISRVRALGLATTLERYIEELRLTASRDQLLCRHACREPQNAIRIASSLQQIIVRSPCVRCALRKLHRLTSIVFERDRVIFVQPALFAPAFVTRGCTPPRAPTADLSFIRKTEQRRKPFVADVFASRRN